MHKDNMHNTTSYPFPTLFLDWSVPMWALCFLHQLFAMVYMLCTLCCKVEQGFLYTKSPLFTKGFFLSYILALSATISWLLLWDRGPEYIWISAATLFAAILCLVFSNVALMLSSISYTDYLEIVKKEHVYRSFVAFVINGINFFIAWLLSFFCLVSLPATLYENVKFMDESSANAPISSSVGLNVLCILIVVHLIVDFVLFERSYRYVYTPYIVFSLVMAGLLADNWNLTEGKMAEMKEMTTYFIQVIAMAALSIILLVTKLIISCIRCSATSGNSSNLIQEKC